MRLILALLANCLLSSAPVSPRQNLAILSAARTPICGAVLIGPDQVLSAAHCVENDDAVMIRCGGEDIPAEILRRDADEDLVLLELAIPCANSSPSPLVEIATVNPEIGDDTWAIGYPAGRAAMSRGIVSAYEFVSMPAYDLEQHPLRYFLKTDAAINAGNSGGGLFDSRGRLIGICSMTRGSFGLHVPASRIRKFLGQK